MKKVIFYILIISLIVSCKHQQKVSSYKSSIPLILVSEDSKQTHDKWLSHSAGNHNFKCLNM